ncbi:hypothetical protein STEG23_030868 [Scotinomys teguina]
MLSKWNKQDTKERTAKLCHDKLIRRKSDFEEYTLTCAMNYSFIFDLSPKMKRLGNFISEEVGGNIQVVLYPSVVFDAVED